MLFYAVIEFAVHIGYIFCTPHIALFYKEAELFVKVFVCIYHGGINTLRYKIFLYCAGGNVMTASGGHGKYNCFHNLLYSFLCHFCNYTINCTLKSNKIKGTHLPQTTYYKTETR